MKEKYQELQASTGTLHISVSATLDQLQKASERNSKAIIEKLYRYKTEQFDEKLKSLGQEYQEQAEAARNSRASRSESDTNETEKCLNTLQDHLVEEAQAILNQMPMWTWEISKMS